MPKFIAKQSLGHFRPGDEIKGLEDKQLQALLVSGAIEEEAAPEKPKQDGSAQQLTELAAEIADLKANNQLLSDDKVKADAEIADLKAQVAELDKQLKAATAKKPATKTADDAK